MSVNWIEPVGDNLVLNYDDGDRIIAFAAGNGKYIPSRKKTVKDNGGGSTPGDGGGTIIDGDGIIITAEMIMASVRAVGGTTGSMLQTAQQVADGFNAAIAKTYPGILTNKKRAACFVGQSAAETGGFSLTQEVLAGPSQQWLVDLQNRYKPYIGRGWIQITWRESYAAFGAWLKGLGVISDANMFVNNPPLLAKLEWAPYTTVYQFTQEKWPLNGKQANLFEWCDVASDPWETIGRAINTGSPTTTFDNWYGKKERRDATNAVLRVTPDPQIKNPADNAYRLPIDKGSFTYSARFGQTGAWATYHTGTDFAAPVGTPIKAVANGKLIDTMHLWQAGTSRVLDVGNGERVAYWHMREDAKPVGSVVKSGDVIGYVGMTGRTFGAHLHFEYYPKGANYNDIYTATDSIRWFKSKGVST